MEDFDSALRGIDVILLVSGMDHLDNRIQQHLNVINVAKTNGLSKIVYTSIIGKDGNSTFTLKNVKYVVDYKLLLNN